MQFINVLSFLLHWKQSSHSAHVLWIHSSQRVARYATKHLFISPNTPSWTVTIQTMPDAPTFGPVPEPLWASSERYPKKAPRARDHLQQLHQQIRYSTPDSSWGYAHGSWGYTVLRTVYTPQSDALFRAAMERLRKYVRFWCHEGRFPSYGERAEQKQITFAEPNDELARRFHLDVIDDRERLASLDGDADGLAGYFRWWVAGVDAGGARGRERGWDPRFCTYLVVDAESLESLAGIPDKPPPLRCARDLDEKRRFLAAGEGAWVWLVDALPQTGEEDDGENHGKNGHRGWLRVELFDIEAAWFDRLVRCICADQAPFFRREEPTGSGIFYYSEQYVAFSSTQGVDLN